MREDEDALGGWNDAQRLDAFDEDVVDKRGGRDACNA